MRFLAVFVIETFRKSVCWPFGGGRSASGGGGGYMSYVMKFSWLTLFLKPAKNIVLPAAVGGTG